jgi:hypothetical protein
LKEPAQHSHFGHTYKKWLGIWQIVKPTYNLNQRSNLGFNPEFSIQFRMYFPNLVFSPTKLDK